MSRQPLPLTGRRFGRLTVLQRAPSSDARTRWLCRCDCGTTTVAIGSHIAHGKTTRVRDAADAIFTRHQTDTVHVDRPGARVVRGTRY